MSTVNRSVPPQIKRLDIEGPVILKRKKAWVRRIGKIQNCIFSYRNTISDKKEKQSIDLRIAKIFLSPAGDNRKQSMIYIQANPLKPDAIRVVFDSEVIFGQWLNAVRENSKTDSEFKEIMKKQEEMIRQSQINQS